MTRLLLIILLFLCSAPAYAEWVKVSASDDKAVTVYADPDTIRRKGNLVKLWSLVDYKTIQTYSGGSVLSAKGQSEYDCEEERTRVLGGITFSGNMGRGEVVARHSEKEQWVPVSIGQLMWKLACAKK
jgi:hypothetical protein